MSNFNLEEGEEHNDRKKGDGFLSDNERKSKKRHPELGSEPMSRIHSSGELSQGGPLVENDEYHFDEMKKGSSNILVRAPRSKTRSPVSPGRRPPAAAEPERARGGRF